MRYTTQVWLFVLKRNPTDDIRFRPSNPLKVLGEYLIKKSDEIEQKQNEWSIGVFSMSLPFRVSVDENGATFAPYPEYLLITLILDRHGRLSRSSLQMWRCTLQDGYGVFGSSSHAECVGPTPRDSCCPYLRSNTAFVTCQSRYLQWAAKGGCSKSSIVISIGKTRTHFNSWMSISLKWITKRIVF